jgi:hypothetical protein
MSHVKLKSNFQSWHPRPWLRTRTARQTPKAAGKFQHKYLRGQKAGGQRREESDQQG